MKMSSPAPTIQSPTWNQYRSRVIAAIADVEVLMQQRGKGLNSEGMTGEVAERLGLDIATPTVYEDLLKLVQATRRIAQEGLRRTREEQGGQYSLLL